MSVSPVIVVEDDPFTRLIPLVLDLNASEERRAAFADFMSTDEPDFEVTGIFHGRERARQRARRRAIDRARRFLIERFVWPFVVVLLTKPIEADLGSFRRLSDETRMNKSAHEHPTFLLPSETSIPSRAGAR